MTTTVATRTPAAVSLPGGLPALISDAGERTAWRFVCRCRLAIKPK